MKPVITILLLFLISCSENQEETESKEWIPLSESEKFSAVNQAYGNHVVSNNRQKILYSNFFELEDSSSMIDYVRRFENKTDQVLFPPKLDLTTPKKIVLGGIDKNLLPDFNFIDHTFIDSIVENALFLNDLPRYYAITAPFQPDSSELLIIQKFEVLSPISTSNKRYVFYILEKKNGKWEVVEENSL